MDLILTALLGLALLVVSYSSAFAQDRPSPDDGNISLKPLHDGPGSTLLSWNGTTPESPNGERIAYFRMPNVKNNEGQKYTGEQWICDADLTDRRKVFEMEMRTAGFEHNGSMATWIDNQRLAFRSTGGNHNTIYVLNVDTGEVLHEIAAHKGSIAHVAVRQKLAFGVAQPSNVKANRERYPAIDEPGLYMLDVPSGEISKIVTLKKINEFFRSRGYTPKEDATFVHVIPNFEVSRVMTRWVPEGSGRGLLLSHDMNGEDMVVFNDRPLHQLWYDNDTYIAVDRRGQRVNENRIVHFKQDGTVIDVLAGPGNHYDISPDRQWLVTDSNYHQTPITIRLYQRGKLEPAAVLDRHSYGKAVWDKGAHENPVFSRDGQHVYFTRAVSNNRVRAVRADVSSIVKDKD